MATIPNMKYQWPGVKEEMENIKANQQIDDLDTFVRAVIQECIRARKMYPGNVKQMTVFFEEAGEVAKAFIDHDTGNETAMGVYAECVQAAAMAAWLAVEGSAEFSYQKPSQQEIEGYKP